MTSPEPRAVFISYSSEDVDAAQRIATALGQAGIEVWFDRSELRGGDAWDQNIRRQIRECALFLPVISATTERRPEGYFRFEWRLADQRTHHMGRTKAFLIPVAIDALEQDNADVPDSFLAVHWTHLPDGQPSPEFVERVKALLAGSTAPDPGRPRPGPAPAEPEAPASRRRAYWGVLAAIVLVLAGAGSWFATRSSAEVEKSIAVRPFDDLSDGAAPSTTFVDGIQADLVNKLGLIRDLRAIGRTSMLQYRNSTKGSDVIADEQGVNYVLEGEAWRTTGEKGDKVRLTARLIDARTNSPIHTWQFPEQDISALFDMQASIVQDIASRLSITLSDIERAQIGTKPTNDQSAFELYQLVELEDKLEVHTRAWLDQQEQRLLTVIASDRKFRGAWALLAIIHSRQIGNFFDTSEDRLRRAREAKEGVEAIDREQAPAGSTAATPEVVRSQGVYYDLALHDRTKAAERFQELAKLQPNNADAPGYLGAVLMRDGDWDDSLRNLAQAYRINPGNLLHARTLETTLAGLRMRLAELVRERIVQARDIPTERHQQAALVYRLTGNAQVGADYFKGLPSAQLESPEILPLRLRWARLTGDLETAIQLDRTLSQGDPGEEEPADALEAAATLAASGNLEAARTRLAGIPALLRAQLEEQPTNAVLLGRLGLAEALLGNAEPALAAGREGVELLPDSLDATLAPVARTRLALIQAWLGDKPAAIAAIKTLLQKPFFPASIHTMKTDPWFFPLRGEADFAALLADPQNNAPLYQGMVDLGRGGRGGPGGRAGAGIDPGRGGRGRGGEPGGDRGGGGRGDFNRGSPQNRGSQPPPAAPSPLTTPMPKDA